MLIRTVPSSFARAAVATLARSGTLVLLSGWVPAQSTPTLTPWIYQANGELVWKEHRYLETSSNTVFALARDIVTLPDVDIVMASGGGPITVPQQAAARPEVLLCNFAQFDPPEGVPATTRNLAHASVAGRGLQLYVNYSKAIVDHTAPVLTTPKLYAGPTFFVSTAGGNDQTTPQVVDLGFAAHNISATRAAFGVFGIAVAAHSNTVQVAPSYVTDPNDIAVAALVNAVYVTAGIGYSISEMTDTVFATEVCTDRFLVRDASGYWVDETFRIPTSATLGNSSGVAFADFDGDMYMDLYVGMQGDNYGGAEDRLLIYHPTTGMFVDQTTARCGTLPSNATNEVAAGDLNGDGYLDIVSVGRTPQYSTIPSAAEDFALINDGTGNFTLVMLDSGVKSDSRSVAIGDLDEDGSAEVVIANAGADGFSNVLAIPPADDHPTQIFTSSDGWVTTFEALTTFMTTGQEFDDTQPWAVQVLVADVVAPAGPGTWDPDGHLDLIFVNHRDISLTPNTTASNVAILTNEGGGFGLTTFTHNFAYPTFWGNTVALEDFSGNPTHRRELFNGGGNRFLNRRDMVVKMGGDFFDDTYDLMPATEHGYGFDFADVDGNGTMEAGQTSRGYDYLVRDIGATTSGHNGRWHIDYAIGTQVIGNERGRKNPKGMEDLCFDRLVPPEQDSDPLQAIVVGQRYSSATTPRTYPDVKRNSAPICVLHHYGAGLGFHHDIQTQALFDSTGQVGTSFCDALIDPNRRENERQSGIADRVDIADMDNDGLLDALVLFQGIADGGILQRMDNTTHFPTPVYANYLNGWSYLRNMGAVGGAPTFRDVATTRMRDATGVYGGTWNRGQGACVIADFNNDGRLDYYTTFSRSANALNGPSGGANAEVADVDQLRDFLFMNMSSPFNPGILEERGATLLPAPQREIIQDTPADVRLDSVGSPFVAQGDIDNDGDADVVVAHIGDAGDRTSLPSLYINYLNTPTAAFLDEFVTHVDFASIAASTSIHSTVPAGFFPPGAPTGYPTGPIDEIPAIALGDIDGDGDLDMICAVLNNVPRVLMNMGSDTNNDSVINALDPPPSQLGWFVDATDTVVTLPYSGTDCTDIQIVDLDCDGDFDLAIDPFQSAVSLWRNGRDLGTSALPTGAIPRVGARRGATIEIRGSNFTNATAVRFRMPGMTPVVATPTAILSDKRLKVVIPTSLNLGLAQIQVRVGNRWSRQYMGYFIQE